MLHCTEVLDDIFALQVTRISINRLGIAGEGMAQNAVDPFVKFSPVAPCNCRDKAVVIGVAFAGILVPTAIVILVVGAFTILS